MSMKNLLPKPHPHIQLAIILGVIPLIVVIVVLTVAALQASSSHSKVIEATSIPTHSASPDVQPVLTP